jgi:hypothetical protein
MRRNVTDFIATALVIAEGDLQIMMAAKSAFVTALMTLQIAFGDDKARRNKIA